MAQFGIYPSIGDFITAYEADLQQEPDLEAAMAERTRRNPCARRAIVQVKATIRVHEPDDNDSTGGRHHHLLIRLSEIVASDDRVREDIDGCLADESDVFVAIRFGDSLGIDRPVTGIDDEDAVEMKGHWIPAEEAQDHGGERVAVLHFTHRPCGYIDTEDGRFE